MTLYNSFCVSNIFITCQQKIVHDVRCILRLYLFQTRLREVLGNNNIYLEALQLGIANYTALAEKIKPEIERLIGYEVNQNTIVVAIKRLVDALEKTRSQHNTKSSISTKVKMSLTGSIIDIDFQKENDDDDDILTNVLDEVL